MKLFAKWVLDNRNEIPEEVACTQKICAWSVPQSRDRIAIKSPESRPKRKAEVTSPESEQETETKRKRIKGVESTLYDARSLGSRFLNLGKLKILANDLRNQNPNMPVLNVIDEQACTLLNIKTQFGMMPTGSLLAIQCPTIPPDFNVHCNIDVSTGMVPGIYTYPAFPLHENFNEISGHLDSLKDEKKRYVNALKIEKEDVNVIEKKTLEQANNKDWFLYRKNRFTASLNNIMRSKNPKSEKGFVSLAKSLVSPLKINNILV